MMNIHYVVYSFKTKHQDGLISSEIADLLRKFPTVNRRKFNRTISKNQCIIIRDETIYYKWDVEFAIKKSITMAPKYMS